MKAPKYIVTVRYGLRIHIRGTHRTRNEAFLRAAVVQEEIEQQERNKYAKKPSVDVWHHQTA